MPTPLRQLIAELERATLPILGESRGSGRYVVLGWPKVDHPEIVRRWLGAEALDASGELADPEAAGWALAAARRLGATGISTALDALRPCDDLVAEAYINAIWWRWGK